MENLLLAASVVVPLFIYMAIGRLIRQFHLFSQENFKSLNVVIFRVFIPLSLFFDVYEADFGEAVRPDVFLYTSVLVILVFLISWIIFTKHVPNQADASTMIQGVYRSNYVLFGTTIAAPLCPQSGVALVAALAALIVPLFNILAVILFEIKRGGKIKPSQLICNIFKNPLVDAGILGCAFSILQIPVPELIASPLIKAGNIASPLALITLGGMLSFGSILKHLKYLITVITAKLILVPFFALAFFILLGYRGDVLVAILAVFASPTAVASTPMAQTMGGNGTLAGEIVALTSACSILTIFLFVMVLSGNGLI